MKKILIILLILIISAYFILFNKHVNSETFYAMGTKVTISIAEKNFDKTIFEKSENEFKRVEALFKDKLDMQNPEIQNVYKKSLLLYKYTNGEFSPYLNEVLKLWQFNKTNKTITQAPTKEQIAKALKSKDVNLYAIAKGYAVDKVSHMLINNGINNFIVDAGGDLFVKGTKFGQTWAVGLKHSNKILKCELDEYAIATSSNLYNYYEFNGKKYGHLINGKTGWPTQANKAITILTTDAALADGLATAIFVSESSIKKIRENIEFSVLKQTEQNFSTFSVPENCKMTNFGL